VFVGEAVGADGLAGDPPEQRAWPMRANFSQASKATIGQVASDEDLRRRCGEGGIGQRQRGREGAEASWDSFSGLWRRESGISLQIR
jgi:hypothetical protein